MMLGRHLLRRRPRPGTAAAAAAAAVRALSSPPARILGDPTLAAVPPGACAFGPDTFTPVPLLRRARVSPDAYLLTFGLPPGATK